MRRYISKIFPLTIQLVQTECQNEEIENENRSAKDVPPMSEAENRIKMMHIIITWFKREIYKSILEIPNITRDLEVIVSDVIKGTSLKVRMVVVIDRTTEVTQFINHVERVLNCFFKSECVKVKKIDLFLLATNNLEVIVENVTNVNLNDFDRYYQQLRAVDYMQGNRFVDAREMVSSPFYLEKCRYIISTLSKIPHDKFPQLAVIVCGGKENTKINILDDSNVQQTHKKISSSFEIIYYLKIGAVIIFGAASCSFAIWKSEQHEFYEKIENLKAIEVSYVKESIISRENIINLAKYVHTLKVKEHGCLLCSRQSRTRAMTEVIQGYQLLLARYVDENIFNKVKITINNLEIENNQRDYAYLTGIIAKTNKLITSITEAGAGKYEFSYDTNESPFDIGLSAISDTSQIDDLIYREYLANNVVGNNETTALSELHQLIGELPILNFVKATICAAKPGNRFQMCEVGYDHRYTTRDLMALNKHDIEESAKLLYPGSLTLAQRYQSPVLIDTFYKQYAEYWLDIPIKDFIEYLNHVVTTSDIEIIGGASAELKTQIGFGHKGIVQKYIETFQNRFKDMSENIPLTRYMSLVNMLALENTDGAIIENKNITKLNSRRYGGKIQELVLKVSNYADLEHKHDSRFLEHIKTYLSTMDDIDLIISQSKFYENIFKDIAGFKISRVALTEKIEQAYGLIDEIKTEESNLPILRFMDYEIEKLLMTINERLLLIVNSQWRETLEAGDSNIMVEHALIDEDQIDTILSTASEIIFASIALKGTGDKSTESIVNSSDKLQLIREAFAMRRKFVNQKHELMLNLKPMSAPNEKTVPRSLSFSMKCDQSTSIIVNENYAQKHPMSWTPKLCDQVQLELDWNGKMCRIDIVGNVAVTRFIEKIIKGNPIMEFDCSSLKSKIVTGLSANLIKETFNPTEVLSRAFPEVLYLSP